MALKFCSSVANRLKLNARKFLGLIPTFVEIIREKLVGKDLLPSVMNRVKAYSGIIEGYGAIFRHICNSL